jgi:16S rRNA (adenine(1408)-N(1))-methyltransferase
VIVDIGTGDGRAVLARAAAEPRAFVVGIDSNAAAMAESSRRASRGRQALPNACFVVAAAEALPGPLAGVADLVTVTMPWGSLLRGVLGLDERALRGVASVVAPGGRVEVIVSVVPSDHVAGLDALGQDDRERIASVWAPNGFELSSMCAATGVDLLASRSSWARRLGERPVWRLELRSCDGQPAGPRTPDQDGRH